MEKVFFSAFRLPIETPSSPSGSPFKDEKQVKFDSNGNRYLAVVGQLNLYDYINSFADEVDINKLIAKCHVAGDFSLLNRVQGFFGDFTGIPTHVTDLKNEISKIDAIFASLPSEVKAAYGDIGGFVSSLGAEDGFSVLASRLNENIAKKEVVINESVAG